MAAADEPELTPPDGAPADGDVPAAPVVVPPGLVPALPDVDDPGLGVAAALFNFTCPVAASLQCVAADTAPLPDADGDDVCADAA